MSEVPTSQSPDAAPAAPPERWSAWLGRHKLWIAAGTFVVLALVALNVWILPRRQRYLQEIDRLQASMSQLEQQRSDHIVAQEENKLRLAIALIRRQSRLEGALHLSVTLDSGAMFLERQGALLREMPVQVGAGRRVGIAPDTVHLAAPRGVRTIARIIDDTTAWEVPAWVYLERGIEMPPSRLVRGALGTALMLDGGAIIYSQPATGPLADSTYVLPGAIRARGDDLRAILPNLTPGIRVYLY